MEILVMHFRGPVVLDLGSCFQWTKDILGFGSFFHRIKDFGALVYVFKGPKVLDLDSCFQRTKDFLGFDSCFQRTKGFGS